MIELFLDDVATPLAPPPTRSASPQAQLRLVTWNLNILCGPDWNTPVQAAEVASLLESLEADVLVLQELPNEALDKLWSAVLTEPLQRVRELDGLLRAKGWTLLRSLAENSTLLAVSSRLQVEATEAFHLDDEPTASLNGDEPLDDGVAARLRAAGFRCAYELGARNNFGGRPAPPLTHWTGTTVDFAYVSGAGAAWEVLGAYAVHTPLSDHLPVIIDVSARG